MENLNYAGFGWRWLAYIIDGIILTIAGFILGMGVGLLCMLILMPMGLDKMIIQAVIKLVAALTGLIMQWLYFAIMESSPWQATVGKRLLKISVTDMEGNRLSFGRASGRYFGKIVSTITCMVGFIMAAFTERKQALHDMIASTLVLRQEN